MHRPVEPTCRKDGVWSSIESVLRLPLPQVSIYGRGFRAPVMPPNRACMQTSLSTMGKRDICYGLAPLGLAPFEPVDDNGIRRSSVAERRSQQQKIAQRSREVKIGQRGSLVVFWFLRQRQ